MYARVFCAVDVLHPFFDCVCGVGVARRLACRGAQAERRDKGGVNIRSILRYPRIYINVCVRTAYMIPMIDCLHVFNGLLYVCICGHNSFVE